MTYKEVVDKVRKSFGKADVSNYEDHLAIQINITGEGAGAFYTEINNGKLFIEEYTYDDNNAVFTASADDIIKIFSGKLDMAKATETGKLEITGDFAKAFSIQPVIDGNKKVTKKKNSKTAAEEAAEESSAKNTKSTKATAAKAVKAESKTTAKKVKETETKAVKKSSRTTKKG